MWLGTLYERGYKPVYATKYNACQESYRYHVEIDETQEISYPPIPTYGLDPENQPKEIFLKNSSFYRGCEVNENFEIGDEIEDEEGYENELWGGYLENQERFICGHFRCKRKCMELCWNYRSGFDGKEVDLKIPELDNNWVYDKTVVVENMSLEETTKTAEYIAYEREMNIEEELTCVLEEYENRKKRGDEEEKIVRAEKNRQILARKRRELLNMFIDIDEEEEGEYCDERVKSGEDWQYERKQARIREDWDYSNEQVKVGEDWEYGKEQVRNGEEVNIRETKEIEKQENVGRWEKMNETEETGTEDSGTDSKTEDSKTYETESEEELWYSDREETSNTDYGDDEDDASYEIGDFDIDTCERRDGESYGEMKNKQNIDTREEYVDEDWDESVIKQLYLKRKQNTIKKLDRKVNRKFEKLKRKALEVEEKRRTVRLLIYDLHVQRFQARKLTRWYRQCQRAFELPIPAWKKKLYFTHQNTVKKNENPYDLSVEYIHDLLKGIEIATAKNKL